jgi:hypothetical protein
MRPPSKDPVHACSVGTHSPMITGDPISTKSETLRIWTEGIGREELDQILTQ